MLSMDLPNKAPAFIETPTDHFDRPFADEDIASLEPDLAARFRATLQAAADKAYEIGKANGQDEAEEATTKAMRCDFEQGLVEIVFNIVGDDIEAALNAVGSLAMTFGAWRQFKTWEAKAKDATKRADGGSRHVG